MQIAQFRTSPSVRHHAVAVPSEPPMIGNVVEYARFVEVQQRRARVRAELLHRSPEGPRTTLGAAVDDHTTQVGVSHIDASTTPGTVDVR